MVIWRIGNQVLADGKASAYDMLKEEKLMNVEDPVKSN